uniref:CAM1 n=1 Tax=Arundo donax TaxID=35708 RepID=A0A0A9HFN8_ARUDO
MCFFYSFAQHLSLELLIAHVSVTIPCPHHLLDFLISQFFSKVRHHVMELSGRNMSILIHVKQFECFFNFFL